MTSPCFGCCSDDEKGGYKSVRILQYMHVTTNHILVQAKRSSHNLKKQKRDETYMILIDTMIGQCLLTQFKAFFVESTPNGKPPLIVQGFVAGLEENFAIVAMETSIFIVGPNQDFVTGYGQKGKLLSGIAAIAFVHVEFVLFTINLVESVPAFSGPASALVVTGNAPCE